MRNWLAVALIVIFVTAGRAAVWGWQRENVDSTYDKGLNGGYTAGNLAGYQKGFVDGNLTGYQVGWSAGNSTNYQSGLLDANNPIHIQDGQVQFNSTELHNFGASRAAYK